MEEKILCRGPCKKEWPKYGKSSFLRHISQAKRCKVLYSEVKISSLKSSSLLRKKEQDLQKKKDAYDPSLRKQKHQSSYDPSARKQKHQSTYDPSVRKRKHQSTYDPSTRREKHQSTYDPRGRKEQHRKTYNTQKRQLKYKTDSDSQKQTSTMRGQILNFRHECQHGPIFVCICCMRDMFKRGVKKITPSYEAFLRGSDVFKYLQTEEFTSNITSKGKAKKIRLMMKKRFKENLRVHGEHYLCSNCYRYLKKLEMPPICAKNSLEYADIPDCLQLTNLERQMICKDLVFIKIRQLPRCRMDAMNDRVINVPIEDDDIIKTVTSLPRTEKNNGMITVGLKRDLSLKNFHKLQMIRPAKVHEALLTSLKIIPTTKTSSYQALKIGRNNFHSRMMKYLMMMMIQMQTLKMSQKIMKQMEMIRPKMNLKE